MAMVLFYIYFIVIIIIITNAAMITKILFHTFANNHVIFKFSSAFLSSSSNYVRDIRNDVQLIPRKKSDIGGDKITFE